MFVIDLKTEAIAVREAQRLRIPIIGLVDTNCDPDGIDYVVPGNDDAIKSCAVVAHAIGDVVREGRLSFTRRGGAPRARGQEERRAARPRSARAARPRSRRAGEAEEAAAAEALPRPRARATAPSRRPRWRRHARSSVGRSPSRP